MSCRLPSVANKLADWGRRAWLLWWYFRRAGRTPLVAAVATARLVPFLVREAWGEKTAVSIYALSVAEENAMRHARAALARYIGMPRLSPEEYFVVCARLVDTYTRGRLDPLTKTEACKLVTERRRYRP